MVTWRRDPALQAPAASHSRDPNSTSLLPISLKAIPIRHGAGTTEEKETALSIGLASALNFFPPREGLLAHPKGLLQHLWETSDLRDVSITAGWEEGPSESFDPSRHGEFLIHSCVLGASSPVFHAGFFDQDGELKTTHFRLPESSEVMLALLQHLYQVDWPLLKPDNAERYIELRSRLVKLVQLLDAAKEYKLALLESRTDRAFERAVGNLTDVQSLVFFGRRLYERYDSTDPAVLERVINRTHDLINEVFNDRIADEMLSSCPKYCGDVMAQRLERE